MQLWCLLRQSTPWTGQGRLARGMAYRGPCESTKYLDSTTTRFTYVARQLKTALDCKEQGIIFSSAQTWWTLWTTHTKGDFIRRHGGQRFSNGVLEKEKSSKGGRGCAERGKKEKKRQFHFSYYSSLPCWFCWQLCWHQAGRSAHPRLGLSHLFSFIVMPNAWNSNEYKANIWLEWFLVGSCSESHLVTVIRR